MNETVLVVVPLLLVPVVLVLAFAGCGLNVVGQAEILDTRPSPPPPPPKDSGVLVPADYAYRVSSADRIVAYWRLDEKNSSTTFASYPLPAFPVSFPGHYIGAFVFGEPGVVKIAPDASVKLDGQAYAEVDGYQDQLNAGARFSIEAWVKLDTTAASAAKKTLPLITSRDAAGGFELMMTVAGGKLTAFEGHVYDGAASTKIVAPLPAGSTVEPWRHVMFTYDGTTSAGEINLYVHNYDGTPVTPPNPVTKAAYVRAGSGSRFRMGARLTPNATEYAPACWLDEVAVYHAPLSSKEAGDRVGWALQQ